MYQSFILKKGKLHALFCFLIFYFYKLHKVKLTSNLYTTGMVRSASGEKYIKKIFKTNLMIYNF
jgi:hypothetical protein